MTTNPPITYRTFTGFGEATHEAVLASMGSLQCFCTNPKNYLFRLLGPSKLLKLPNELLLQIAYSIDGVDCNQDLRHLALACRRLRPIAQEALVCNAVVTSHTIRSYLKILLQHPEHIAKMPGRLHLHATNSRSWPRDTAFLRRSQDWRIPDSPIYQHCHEIIEDTYGQAGLLRWTQDLFGNTNSIRCACLAALLLVIPKLKELTVTDIFIKRSTLLHRSFCRTSLHNDWRQSAMKTFTPNLHTLHVMEGGNHSDPFLLGFLDFTSLKHLSVPTKDLVIHRYTAPTAFAVDELAHPSEALPRSLETLCIFVREYAWERGYTLRWLERLLLTQTVDFPALERIQVYFKNTVRLFQKELRNPTSNHYLSDTSITISDDQASLLRDFESQEVGLELLFLKAERPIFDVSTFDMYDRSNYHQVCHKHALISWPPGEESVYHTPTSICFKP